MSEIIRKQAIDPSASYLVQAPAGSGKTELLTQRILALLATVDEPEEIMALTFTRKAAAEMGSRVIDALTMEKPADSESHRMATWLLAGKVRSRSEERGWNLPQHPNRLRIMTLDSLTGSLARQLPLLSGLGDIPTPSEHSRAAYKLAAEQTLNRAMQLDSSAVETLLLHQDHNTAAVIEQMVKMLENREQWLPCIAQHGRQTDTLKAVIESNLSALIKHKIELCNDKFPVDAKAALPALLQFAGSSLNHDSLSSFHTWPAPGAENISSWKVLAHFLLTADKPQLRKSVDKRSGFPADDKEAKQRMIDLLSLLDSIHGLADSLHALRLLPDHVEFEPTQWQLAEALFELLPQAVMTLQSIFSTQGKTDFTEIALSALQALNDSSGNPSELLLKLDYRIHHILVDEFQDTSELQMQLLRCLTAGWQQDDGRTLFMVGDPMQSIYRFRKAEVGLFLQAADNSAGLPSVTQLQLERNFRSSPVIVDWVNRAFSQIFPPRQDAISGAIAHAKAASALPLEGSVTVHLQTATDESEPDDETEAAVVVGLIQQALADNQRVGVLARTRKHLQATIHALNEANIAYRAINILPLHRCPEVRTLRALLRALLHPADKESWFALLRAPCCGLNTNELFSMFHGDERSVWETLCDASVIEKLEPDALSRVIRLKKALSPCMMVSGRIRIRDLVTSAWQRLGMPLTLNESASTNIETVLDLIDSLDENGLIDFQLLDERIEKLFAAPATSTDASKVELLTMHGAKGLQWDVVILPGLGKPPKNSDQPLLAFTEAPMDGKPLFLMSPKAETFRKNELFSLVQSVEKEKERHEFSRLLYVACTRAQRHLHLMGNLSKKGEAEKGSLLEIITNDKSCFGAQIIPIQPQQGPENSQRLPLLRIKQLPPLSASIHRHPIREPEYGWAGPTATPIGNVLHTMLQQVAEKGVENWGAQESQDAIKVMRWMLMAEGLSGDLLTSSLKRCADGLTKTLNSKLGTWILSGNHTDAHSEWALTHTEQNEASYRIIDRTFIDEDGIRWIIDYKTGSHEGSDLNAFLDSEEERYRAQVEGYRELLEKMEPERMIRMALYFPILDGWREIKKQRA